MDAVAYLQEFKDHTAIHFVGGLSAEGRAMIGNLQPFKNSALWPKCKPPNMREDANRSAMSALGY
jgi:hypothetical protein